MYPVTESVHEIISVQIPEITKRQTELKNLRPGISKVNRSQPTNWKTPDEPGTCYHVAWTDREREKARSVLHQRYAAWLCCWFTFRKKNCRTETIPKNARLIKKFYFNTFNHAFILKTTKRIFIYSWKRHIKHYNAMSYWDLHPQYARRALFFCLILSIFRGSIRIKGDY